MRRYGSGLLLSGFIVIFLLLLLISLEWTGTTSITSTLRDTYDIGTLLSPSNAQDIISTHQQQIPNKGNAK
jgi:hypothetical protein